MSPVLNARPLSSTPSPAHGILTCADFSKWRLSCGISSLRATFSASGLIRISSYSRQPPFPEAHPPLPIPTVDLDGPRRRAGLLAFNTDERFHWSESVIRGRCGPPSSIRTITGAPDRQLGINADRMRGRGEDEGRRRGRPRSRSRAGQEGCRGELRERAERTARKSERRTRGNVQDARGIRAGINSGTQTCFVAHSAQ